MPAESSPLLRPTLSPVSRISTIILLCPLLLLPFLLFLPPYILAPPPRSTSSPKTYLPLPQVHIPVPYVPHTFLMLGDWGRKGKHGQSEVANSLGQTVANRFKTHGYNPHYIISTGDNFYSKGVQSPDDPKFNASFIDIYTHYALTNLPWYTVLGNHDHLGSIDAQLKFSARDRRWNMPAQYYTRQFADNLLTIFLDTTPFADSKYGVAARANGNDPQKQLDWLEKQLREAPSHVYFMIVGHHPMYTMSTGGHLGCKPLRQQMLPLLQPYARRILAYVSGHDHSLMHMQPEPRVEMQEEGPFTDVIDHFVSGAGSKLDDIVLPEGEDVQRMQDCCGVLPVSKDTTVPRALWGASVNGFFAFTFDGKVFSADAIDSNGKAVYSYQKTVA